MYNVSLTIIYTNYSKLEGQFTSLTVIDVPTTSIR